MTTLADIPSTKAYHLPTPTSEPILLAEGELVLATIPANPPARPSPTLTLSVGASSWPVLPNTPVRKIHAQKEHASYIFSPAAVYGSEGIGQVKIILADSKSQGEWEATEALAAKFESALQAQGVWDERILFVNDEDANSGVQKGWGESIAAAVTGAGSALATRLGSFTEQHVNHTNPEHPPPPSEAVKTNAKAAADKTGVLADKAEVGASKVGEFIHNAGKAIGERLPDSIAKPAEPVKEEDKGDFRKMAEQGWQQATIAAKGIASAAVTVGTALSENAHKAVEHNFGKEAEGVAQNVGQTGANVGSTGLSAVKATSVIMQGSNAVSGAQEAKSG